MQGDNENLKERMQNFVANIKLWSIHIGTLIFFILTVYSGIYKYWRGEEEKYFSLYLLFFCIFACGSALIKLVFYLQERAFEKARLFDPLIMERPETGSISLEKALHDITVPMGCVMWDTIWGFFFITFILLTVFLKGNRPLMLSICLLVAVSLLVGHILILRLWKKHCFAKKMVHCTKKFMPINSTEEFIAAVEQSLLKNILYYGKELILTEEYLIGRVESTVQFLPVAIPRAEIAETNVQIYDMDVVECRLHSGKLVKLLIGQGTSAIRISKVFQCYQVK